MYLVTKEQYEYFKKEVGGQEAFTIDGEGILKLRGEKVCKKALVGEEVKDCRKMASDYSLWVSGEEEKERTTIGAITAVNEVKRGRPKK